MQPLLPARPRAAAPPILYALLLALGLVALPLVLRAQGGSITVNSLADPGDGRCNPAECTLREAISRAADGDSIDFSVTGSITLTAGPLVISKSLSIAGPGPKSSSMVVDGGGSGRVFQVEGDGTRLALALLTVTGGNAVEGGGGGLLVLPGATLTLDRGTVSGNRAAGGGGGISSLGTLSVTMSTIANNVVTGGGGGGGIEIDSDATAALTNVTVSGNDVASAGFEDNGGGGVRVSAGTVTIANAAIYSNTALFAGGLSVRTNTVTLRNTILAGNTARVFFAALPDCDTAATTFRLNSEGYNLVGNGDVCSGLVPSDQRGTTTMPLVPRLLPLEDNGGPTATHALRPVSPATDAGNPTGCIGANGETLSVDQRGYGRPVDGDGNGVAACDVGAFELDGVAPTPTITTTPATATATSAATRTPTATGTREPSLTPERSPTPGQHLLYLPVIMR